MKGSLFQFGAFYQNWQIFWGSDSPVVSVPTQTPSAWSGIASNFDYISYGFGMFGVEVVESNGTQVYQLTGDYSVNEMYPSGQGAIQNNDSVVFTELQALRSANPGMKILLSLGGWNWCTSKSLTGASGPIDTSVLFYQMVSSQSNRANFIASVISFMQSNGFDGLELDWEYPGNIEYVSQQGPNDFFNFECLVREFKAQAGASFTISLYTAPYLSPTITYNSLPGYPDSWSMNCDADYYKWLANVCNNNTAATQQIQQAPGADFIKVMFYDYNVSGGSNPTLPNAPLTNVTSSSTSCSSCKKRKPMHAGYRANQYKGASKAKRGSSKKGMLGAVNGTIGPVVQAQLSLVSGSTPQTPEDMCTVFNFGAVNTPDTTAWMTLNGLSSLPQNLSTGTPYSICAQEYTVGSGDSFYNICQYFQAASWVTIAAYNGLTQATAAGITVGQVLYMPPVTSAGDPAWSTSCAGPTPPGPFSLSQYIQQNVNGYVAAFNAAGVSTSKIHGGLAYYGRSFKGVTTATGDSGANQFNQPSTGSAPGSFYTGACGLANAGVISYLEIAYLLKNNNNTCPSNTPWPQLASVQNTQTTTPIAYSSYDNYWVSYDDTNSIAAKVNAFQAAGFGGTFAFGPANDDVLNGYPLTMATATAINNGSKRRKRKDPKAPKKPKK
jgi:GH18 family chitinase